MQSQNCLRPFLAREPFARMHEDTANKNGKKVFPSCHFKPH